MPIGASCATCWAFRASTPVGDGFVQRHAAHELLGAVLYLMCDDLNATLKSLTAK